MRAVQGRQPALERAAARQFLRGQEGGRRNRQRRDKVAMTVGARLNVRPWDYGDILGQVTRSARNGGPREPSERRFVECRAVEGGEDGTGLGDHARRGLTTPDLSRADGRAPRRGPPAGAGRHSRPGMPADYL